MGLISAFKNFIVDQIPSNEEGKETLSYDSPSTRLSLESVAVGCVDGDHDDHGDCDDYPDVDHDDHGDCDDDPDVDHFDQVDG